MAVKFIAETDTLEQFRLEFNDLSANQFGDIANLSGSISASNLVDAMNETISIATSTAGWTIADETSTTQIIGGGNTLTVLGTANQIQTAVSPIDTITFSFPNNVTIPNNLTALGTTHTFGSVEINGNNIRSVDTNTLSVLDTLTLSFPSNVTIQNLTTTGSVSTIGTIEFNGSDIRSVDSSGIVFNDAVRGVKFETQNAKLTIDESGSNNNPKISANGGFMNFDAIPVFNSSFAFEGSSADEFETLLTVTNPTADRTLTFPDETGTIVTTGSLGVVTSAMLASGTITGGDIADDSISEAKIADDAVGSDQLKSVVNLQVLNSSGGVLKSIFGAGA